MDIETRLRESLAAREAPPDFEAAVMARVSHAQQGAAPRVFAWRVPAALAATVLAAAISLHWYGEQQRAVHDRDQLLMALAIASHELNEVQQRLTHTDDHAKENGS
jgi:hypothetical protein